MGTPDLKPVAQSQKMAVSGFVKYGSNMSHISSVSMGLTVPVRSDQGL